MNNKNPINAPAKAAVTGAIPLFVPIETTMKNTAIINVTLVANPSKPSVKLAPFTVPNTTKNSIGINNHPMSTV